MLADDNLIWIDLEMTGLNPDTDRILEIATIVTDKQLNILAEGPILYIHQSDETLSKMDAWVTQLHFNSGLTELVRLSKHTEADAEKLTIEFLKQYVPAGKSPICGNTICQDRRFLYRHMPTLEKYFHYRHIDVTTLKILADHWAPQLIKDFNKASKHRALDDIRESIDELRYYRKQLFKAELS